MLFISISAISAENNTDLILAQSDDVDESSDAPLSQSNDIDESSYTPLAANESTDYKSFEDLYSTEGYSKLDPNSNHDESHKIIVDAKADKKITKVREPIVYTIKVTNKNLFDVKELTIYFGEDEFFYLDFIGNHKGMSIFDGEALIIDKLGAGQTKTIKFNVIFVYSANRSITATLSHYSAPYESKSKLKTVVDIPAKVKKSKKAKVKITYKANKKPVKRVNVKVKVYTKGKRYITYKLKTNKKGIIKIKTKNLKKGKHKIVIKSLNKKYSISKTSKIKIK